MPSCPDLLPASHVLQVQEDGELAGSLAARLQERGVRLDALLLDTPGGLNVVAAGVAMGEPCT
jgi:hypothetical protein